MYFSNDRWLAHRLIRVIEREFNFLWEFIRTKGRFRTALDCGAHCGVYSYYLAKHFQHVHSFEVEPEVRSILADNIRSCGCGNVSVYDCGVGDVEQIVNILPGWKWNIQNGSLSTVVLPDGMYKSAQIQSRVATIDSFNFSDVDLIKIDVEGYENKVVDGAINTILKYSPIIVYEDHPKHPATRYGDDRSMLDILGGMGYSVAHSLKTRTGRIDYILERRF